MKKHYSIDQLATATRRQAQAEMAILQGDLRKLRDRLTNVDAMSRNPVIRSKRAKTKRTREQSLLEELGIMASVSSTISMVSSQTAQEEKDRDGGESQSQEAARITETYSLSLRIR